MKGENDTRSDAQCLDEMLVALSAFENELAELISDSSNEINVFDNLGVTNTEIRHSNMIAWLMKPDGEHCIGSELLASLISQAGEAIPDDLSDFNIMREFDGIDILAVSYQNKLTLAIENKVWSGELDNQLARYQAAVERRFPGWKHLYLFLSPLGTPPERDADRAIWIPVSYRAILRSIEDIAAHRAIPPKAQAIIESYIDSVRRHIVGDESLQNRCVELYLEHKRAIDLIMANLPDITKTVHEYALAWAQGLEEVTVVESCSRGKQFVRFRTNSLEKLFPQIEGGSDCWGEQHYWFYEIITQQSEDGIGCNLSLQLSFHLPKKVPISEQRFEAARSFVSAFASGDDGAFYGMWTGFKSSVAHFPATDFDYEEVSKECTRAWEDFLIREQTAIRILLESNVKTK